jgi:hypothetical protein
MQFVVRSPLSVTECRDRLSKSIEGPIPSLGSRLVGWHIFGRASTSYVEASIVGVKVGPDGRKKPSMRPLLKAQIAKSGTGTVITGEVANRYDSNMSRVNRVVAPLFIAGIAVWSLLSLATRWPILGFDFLALAMVAFEWFTRKRFNAIRRECDAELMAWLERTTKGTRDAGSADAGPVAGE